MIESALMRGDDVPERWTLVKHIVPGERKIALRRRSRTIFQRQIRHHPRAKVELANVWRWIVAVRPHDIARHKLRRGEDHARCVKSTWVSSFLIERDDVNADIGWY